MTIEEPRKTAVYLVDAFASGSLRGNPAAVVLSTGPISEDEMSKTAIQLGQPAQAFVWHPDLFQDAFASHSHNSQPVLRWYGSLGQALPLCGHATLAATLVLFKLFPAFDHIKFDTLKGPIEANRLADGYVEAGLLVSKHPSRLTANEANVKAKVAQACSMDVADIVDFQSAQSNSLTEENLLVVLRPEVDLAGLAVDTKQLGTLPYRGFYLTQKFLEPHPKYTFKSRVFFPAQLVPEDQACGSAHTLLAPYWSELLAISSHAEKPLIALQVSGNGAEVGCRFATWQDGRPAFLVGTGKVRAS